MQTASTNQAHAKPGAILPALLVTFTFGLVIRIFAVSQSDFPLNDGGLFYTMIQELQNNHFLIPDFTNYNHAQIPFTYPWLPFYFTGALQALTQIDLFALLRWLPALFSSLTVPAYYLFSRQVLGKDQYAMLAALFFAVLPESYEWEIMGGGITRAPAYFFSILALYQGHRLFTTDSRNGVWKTRLWTTAFASLAACCHLEIALVTMLSLGLMMVFWKHNREGILSFVLVSAGLVIFTTPYWISAIARHGISPFLYAFSSGEFNLITTLLKVLVVHLTIFNSFLVVLIILGWFHQVFQRAYFLPVFFAASLVFDPRSPARSGTLSAAMLISIALLDIILPAIRTSLAHASNKVPPVKPKLKPDTAQAILLSYLFVMALISALVPHFTGETSLVSLAGSERTAMQWITENTPSEVKFLVLNPTVVWANDKSAEWFPALTHRASLSTPQGAEWLPNQQFQIQKDLHLALVRCLSSGLTCLDETTSQYHLGYTHLYFSGFPWNASRLELEVRTSPHFILLYEQDGISILARSAILP